jgi:hypothetical protein
MTRHRMMKNADYGLRAAVLGKSVRNISYPATIDWYLRSEITPLR